MSTLLQRHPVIATLRQWIGVIVGSVLVCGTALAANNPLGFYTGVGLGEATPENVFAGSTPQTVFRSRQLGWDALIGVRPVRWAGAELQYMDLGYTHLGALPANPFTNLPFSSVPSYPFSHRSADAHSYAAGAFAVAYLPLSLGRSKIDVFGKLGAARLWYPAAWYTFFPPGGGSNTSTETDLAYGGGMQVHFGAFAVRAEYELIDASFGNPSLFTLGVTWTP